MIAALLGLLGLWVLLGAVWFAIYPLLERGRLLQVLAEEVVVHLEHDRIPHRVEVEEPHRYRRILAAVEHLISRGDAAQRGRTLDLSRWLERPSCHFA